MDIEELKFKGTKGPWVASNNSVYWDIKKKGSMQCLASTQANEHLGIDEKVEEANAKLIAAAPELLKALQWICEELKDKMSVHSLIRTQKAIEKALK